MKPITISPLSFLLGCLTAAGLVVVLGAQEINRRTAEEIPATAFGDTPFNVVGIPLPSDYYNLREADHSPLELGTPPFLVGDDGIFIVTAIGSELGGGTDPHLVVDGVRALQGGGPGIMEELPRPGFIVPSGSEIVIGDGSGNTQTGRVWGYVLRE